MRYVALDLGSSFTKGAVLNLEKCVVEAQTSAPTPAPEPTPHTRFEIDAQAYLEQVRDMLDTLLDKARDAQGVLLSTQMHGYVLTGGTQRPTYVSWQDAASSEMDNEGNTWLEKLGSRLGAEDMLLTGVPLKGNLAMSNLFARLQGGMRINDGTRFHTLGGYMLYSLCGAYCCHITNAAPTGMANIANRGWDKSLIQKAGLDMLRFPDVVSALTPCGEYVRHGKKYPLYPDVGDHQVCLLGSGTRPQSDWNVNIGTAGIMGRIEQNFRTGDCETRPFFEQAYLLCASSLPGGRHLDVLANFLIGVLCKFDSNAQPQQVWEYLTQCRARGHMKVDLLGCFSKGGSIAGLPKNWTLDETVGSAYAAMADGYVRSARRIGGGAERIVFSGGCALRNPALRDAITRAMGLECVVPRAKDDVMGGMIQLALTISQQAKNLEEARKIWRG